MLPPYTAHDLVRVMNNEMADRESIRERSRRANGYTAETSVDRNSDTITRERRSWMRRLPVLRLRHSQI